MNTSAPTPSEESIKLVIVDDHDMIRAGLRSELDERFEIVGEASTVEGAIDVITTRRPDLVICDLHMPDGGGLAVVNACAEMAPIVVFTASDAERDLLDSIAAGASGYLVKTTPTADLCRQLVAAANGEPVFSPHLAALVIGEFRRIAKQTGGSPLSDREREVLQHVARGNTYGQIGEALFISPKTVENHVRNILGKLHLSRRADLIRYAVDHDII